MIPLIIAILLFQLLGASFADFIEPCDARLDGCFAQNKALPDSLLVPLTEPNPMFDISNSCPLVCFGNDGAELEIAKRFDNPQIHLAGYLLYGTVEADIKAASGTGIILSFYLQSDDKDEIDIAEIFGNNHFMYQTNYFSKGAVSTNGKGIYVGLESSPLYNFHRYGVTWSPEEIIWTVDGSVVRRVERESDEGFPSSPMMVKFSLWVGGDTSNEPGTVTWAGGLTDFSESPFGMIVNNVSIVNANPAEEYTYLTTQPLEIHEGVMVNRFLNGLVIPLEASAPFVVSFRELVVLLTLIFLGA